MTDRPATTSRRRIALTSETAVEMPETVQSVLLVMP